MKKAKGKHAEDSMRWRHDGVGDYTGYQTTNGRPGGMVCWKLYGYRAYAWCHKEETQRSYKTIAPAKRYVEQWLKARKTGA